MSETFSFAKIFDDVSEFKSDVPAVTLDPNEVFKQESQDITGTLVDSGSREPRFDGDTSELAPEVCWTLQALVTAPHISEKDTKNWPVLLQYQEVLRSRLSELGLVLEINQEHRYAFTRQADDPSPHSRIILRAKKLSLAASALSLFLYQRYMTAPDDPIVATDEMVDHMMAYKRPEDTDQKAFRDKIGTAISSLEKAAIIKPVKGTDRYLIYGVITSILTVEKMAALEQRYRAIVRDGKATEGTSADYVGDERDENLD